MVGLAEGVLDALEGQAEGEVGPGRVAADEDALAGGAAEGEVVQQPAVGEEDLLHGPERKKR